MSTEYKKDVIGVALPRLVRRGWRTFLCDECGHHYEAATRDAMSPSGDTCPECNEVNFPAEYRIDAELPCDDYGNLREYLINVFPTNVKCGGTTAQDSKSEANDGAYPPLPPTTCSASFL